MKNLVLTTTLLMFIGLFLSSCEKDSIALNYTKDFDAPVSYALMGGIFSFEKGQVSWEISNTDPLADCVSSNLVANYFNKGTSVDSEYPVFDLSLDRSGHFALSYNLILSPVKIVCADEKPVHFANPPMIRITNRSDWGKFEVVYGGTQSKDGKGKELKAIILESERGETINLDVISFSSDSNTGGSIINLKTKDLGPVTVKVLLRS